MLHRSFFGRSLRASLVGATLAVLPLAAAEAPPSELARTALEHFDAQRWPEAARAYEAVVAAQPGDGDAWNRLGVARFSLERFEEALAAFEKALAAGVTSARQHGMMARAHERLGRRDQAIAALEKAVAEGMSPGTLKDNPAFAPFREDPRFPALVAKADSIAYPCKAEAESAQFDFWVGEWDVLVGGSVGGSSRIEALPGGCLIVENYENPGGFAGKSLNFYDPVRRKWRQLWVDNGGTIIEFEGALRDGSMVFEGKQTDRRGEQSLSRMSFIPQADGSVRQLIERSKDGGKTWAAEFDGKYVRKKPG